MAEMKTFNGYEVVDAKARQSIAELELNGADLTNYYTKAETNAAIGKAIEGIEIPEPDLSPYAKVADMPTKVSQLENDKGYITEHQSLDEKADKAHTHKLNEITDYKAPVIPTKVSELTNDKGYLTEHQSLDGYATTKYVDDTMREIENDVAAYLEENYYTSAQVDDKIAKAATGDVDLSNYYTKSQVDELIPDNYIDAIPDYYVTETELNAKGYLTEHQSLAAYATKQYVTDSLTDVATKDYVNTAVNGANKAASFSDYSAMVTALNTAAKTAYQIGQNIMIVTLAVPDLWVSNISETSSPYTYTTDTAITDTIKANGVVQVGYFTLSALETQKVDLTDYNTSTEVDGKIADAVAGVAETRVKEDTTISINVTNTIPVLNYVYTNPITSIGALTTTRVQGHSIQIKTAASCTVTDTSTWIGDDCADGVFTPVANTNYEIYSYYNQVAGKVINMVMNLGA